MVYQAQTTDEIKTFIQAHFLSLSLPSCLRAVLSAQTCALREENDSLRWQLDAYRNEVELLKIEQGSMYRTEEDHTQEQQLHFLQQTMQNMQQVIQARVTLAILQQK